jgi:primosomal protein N' (replication factor Y)
MTLFAEVILSLPLDKNFLYIVPGSQKNKVKVGSRVLVPFKERKLTGIVIKLKQRGIPKELKLKEIHAVLDDTPLISSEFLSFTKKLSARYYSSWGELLQAALPSSFVPKTQTTVSLADKGQKSLDESKLSGRERDVLLLLKKRSYSDVYLKRKLKMTNLSPFLSKLESKEFIHIKKVVKTESLQRKSPSRLDPTQLEMDFSLDEDSYQAANRIATQWDGQTFLSYYLFGPLEKREAAYFYLIKRALALKRKILYLVPEIAATQNLVEKFQKRFGENAALLHSRMSIRSREEEWSKIYSGQVDVVVGPRSAVLSPVENLGLVIVDEEQDESYIQRESPSYDARKGAHFRAKQDRALLVYGSSAPTVEAYYKFGTAKRLFDVLSESQQSHAEIIDHKIERRLLSPKISAKIGKAIQEKKPILIFHFRRGYASYIACSRCSYVPRCQNCDIALTYHRRDDRSACHYCGLSQRKMTDCPECGHRVIKKRGIGIEAVEEEIKRRFPQSRVLGFDSDVARRKKDQEKLVDLFRERKIDILVGTQLLAHQQELPKVPVIVVLYPETILALPDYRASQKTFQSIIQAAKHLSPGENSDLLIQTSFPDHFSIHSAAHNDFIGFYTQEIKFRRLMNYPPFAHMVEVLFQGENLRSLARKTRDFSSLLNEYSKDVEVLGPALAAVPRLRGKNRIQIVLKSKKRRNLDEALKHTLERVRANKKVLVYY